MRKTLLSGLLTITAALFFGCVNDTPPATPPTPPTPDDPVVEVTYDYDIKAAHAIGNYYFDPNMGGFASVNLVVSEMEVSHDLQYSKAGLALSLDIWGKANGEVELPIGKFKMASIEDKPSDLMVTPISNVAVVGNDNKASEYLSLSEINLEITKAGELHTITMTGKLDNGKTVHCAYTGKVAMKDLAAGGSTMDEIFPPITQNITAKYIDYRASYKGRNQSDAGKFTLSLYTYKNEGYNEEGSVLSVELFATIPGKPIGLAPGKYTIGKSDAAGNIAPGWINEATLQNLGTTTTQHSTKNGKLESFYGIITSGTIEVALDGEKYTITVDMMTDRKYSIKGTYEGELKFRDMSYNSTLTESINVDFTGTPGFFDYYGQAFLHIGIDADRWMATVISETSGKDAMTITLLSTPGSFAAGIPTGRYNVKDTYQTGELVCAPGEYVGSSLQFSWYMMNVQGSLVDGMAPFKTGFVDVSIEDGMYVIACTVFDDSPFSNQMTLKWKGTAKSSDYSKPPVTAPRAAVGRTNQATLIPMMGNAKFTKAVR